MLGFLFNWFSNAPSGAMIFIFIGCLIFGMFFLIKGADIFVSNASCLAHKIGISSLVIGLTIVSFGTSAPEASVSISAAATNADAISIGNIVGSNLFNLLVVLGLSAIFAPVVLSKGIRKRDIPFMLLSSVCLLVFSLWFKQTNDYEILRVEAIILLIIFISYLILVFLKPGEVEENEVKEDKNIWLCLLFLVLGLAGVVIGGELVTYGAKNIALEIGVSQTLGGLTIVAVGTSLPELVTSVVAARKHENEIAIGNVIGSNIFNVLFILGAAGTISPLAVSSLAIYDVIIMLGIFIFFVVLCLFAKDGLKKRHGFILIGIYVLYFIYIILREIV